jgi:hypothetical protein
MAASITLVTVASPTSGLAANLSSGGNLVSGTTYYYRVVAVRRYRSTNVLSLPSLEVSATCDATNKTITVSWDAVTNATHYIVQRTTTSGVYTAGGRNSLHLNGLSSNYTFATTQLQVIDDGVSSSKVEFNGYNCDHAVDYSTIEVNSDTGLDTITMQDIYLADLAAGWGVVDKLCTDGWKSNTNALFTDQVPYTVRGNLLIRTGIFQLRGILYINAGGFRTETDATLMFGTSNYRYFPQIIFLSAYSLYGTTNNTTWDGGYLSYNQGVRVASGSEIYGFTHRGAMTYSTALPFASGVWHDGYGGDDGFTDINFSNCNIGLLGSNGTPVYEGEYPNTVFESVRPYVAELKDVVVRYAQFAATWQNSNIFTRIHIQNPTSYDLLWGSTLGTEFIDSTFESKGQTDNQPYLACVYDYRGLVGQSTLLFKYSLSLKVVDKDGNPISGATVTVKDINGYSDLWEDTGRTLYSNYSDSSTALSFDAITDINAGDILKLEMYHERLLVNSTSAPKTINVTRAQQDTTARPANSTNAPKVWRQIASLVTDSDGIANPDHPLTSRELVINKNDGSYGTQAYENDHVAAGNLIRNYSTPHTLTISAPGYQTKTMILTMDRKREEVVALERQVPVIHTADTGRLILNASPTKAVNQDEWVEAE